MRISLVSSVLAFAAGVLGLDCNGQAEYCDRKYSNVTFVGAHDSPFVGILTSDNQLTSVTKQLDQGVRYLTAQTHNKNGAIQLCHTSCILLDVGTLETFLSTVKTWLDGNTNEVVTLLITNGDAIDITKFADAFVSSGLDGYVFAPNGDLTMDEWPTMGELIANNQRAVIFMDYHADTSQVPYILDEFQYYFETPYSTTDPDFPQCDLDRPSGATADGRMYLVNHVLDLEILPGVLVPNWSKIHTTNSLSSILAQTDICIGNWGRNPNVILLDYISIGDAMETQAELNGI